MTSEKEERKTQEKQRQKLEKRKTLKRTKQEKGITLIALVVTIVVLLILAGVSITVLFGDSGIIKTAQEAADKTNKAMQNEMQDLQNLQDELDKIISGNGNEPGKDEVPLLPGWDKEKVKAEKSDDGVTVPIPIGFVPSTIPEERKVEDGFVIKQGTDGSKKEGVNEFVWVPVTEGKPMFTTTTIDGNTVNIGQLYNFSGEGSNATSTPKTYSATSYREPDILTDTDVGDAVTKNTERGIEQLKTVVGITGADDAQVLANWKTQLQNEFNQMKTSVETYGGFYIGRYETGNLSQTKAVVQKNNPDINNQNWYTMYAKSKTIAEGTKATSSMIWGCQWDACMNWFLTNDSIKGYVTNSTGKGNYAGTQEGGNKPIATGSNVDYQLNNIYDMAGNVFDWTLEANYTDSRVLRGGDYSDSGSEYPVFGRGNSDPYNSVSISGARATLYM